MSSLKSIIPLITSFPSFLLSFFLLPSFHLCFPLFTSASLFLPSFSLCFPLFPSASLFFPTASLFVPLLPCFFPLLSLFSLFFPLFLPSKRRSPGWFFSPLPSSANWSEYIPLLDAKFTEHFIVLKWNLAEILYSSIPEFLRACLQQVYWMKFHTQIPARHLEESCKVKLAKPRVNTTVINKI